MPQHFLNRMEIRPVLQQVCGEGMAQHVGRNILFDLRLLLIVLDNFPKALTGHSLAVHIHKESLFLVVYHNASPNVQNIVLQRLHSPGIQRNAPLLSLAAAHDKPGRKVHILRIQVDKLRDPDPRSVEQLQHGVIPKSFFVHTFRLLKKQLHFPVRQNLRVASLYLFRLHLSRWIHFYVAACQHVRIKGLGGGQKAAHCSGRLAQLLQSLDVFLQYGILRPPKIGFLLLQPLLVLPQIPHIRADGIHGHMLFICQIIAVKRQIIQHTITSLLSRIMKHIAWQTPQVSAQK